MTARRFDQVDVFTAEPYRGNPVAVVHAADGLDDARMQAFARWTNLSETTFLLPPTNRAADYRLRIFTTARELPFAGHPTLGTCHAWLAGGGRPRGETVVQECGVGLVRIRRDGSRLAFAAPPLRRSGAADDEVRARLAQALRIEPAAIRAAQWVDNGPGWVAVLLSTRDEVLALKPDLARMTDGVGVVAPTGDRTPGAPMFEVRAFVPRLGAGEDPVTGSLNAGLAQWLIGAGIAPPHYVASQGTALGRAGRIHVDQVGDDIWIGGDSVTCIAGEVQL